MISSAVYLAGCIIYWFWASGELQPWSKKPALPPIEPASVSPTKPNLVERVTYVGYTNEGADMDE